MFLWPCFAPLVRLIFAAPCRGKQHTRAKLAGHGALPAAGMSRWWARNRRLSALRAASREAAGKGPWGFSDRRGRLSKRQMALMQRVRLRGKSRPDLLLRTAAPAARFRLRGKSRPDLLHGAKGLRTAAPAARLGAVSPPHMSFDDAAVWSAVDEHMDAEQRRDAVWRNSAVQEKVRSVALREEQADEEEERLAERKQRRLRWRAGVLRNSLV